MTREFKKGDRIKVMNSTYMSSNLYGLPGVILRGPTFNDIIEVKIDNSEIKFTLFTCDVELAKNGIQRAKECINQSLK